MGIQPIFPLADLENLLITMSVFFIVVWSRRIIDIIPVLHGSMCFAILLAFLPAPALPLFAHVVPIVFIVFRSGPVGKRAFRRCCECRCRVLGSGGGRGLWY